MKRSILKNKIIFDFVKSNLFILISGFLALLYSCICVFFKASPKTNVSSQLRPLGDFIYNVAISVIAAVIFYIVQVYISNFKRSRIIKCLMKNYCNNVLIKECNMLKIRTETIRNDEKNETEMINAINISCIKVNDALNKTLRDYLSVLPEDLIKAINDVISDDMLYLITIRASGTLVNRSLKEIVNDTFSYNILWERIKKIKVEVDKL